MWRAVLALSSVVLGVAAGLAPGTGAGCLSDALRAAVASEALRKRMDDLGAIPASGEELTPSYVAALIPVEIGRYRALLAGAK